MSRNYELMRRVVDNPPPLIETPRRRTASETRVLSMPANGARSDTDDSDFDMPAILRTLLRRRKWMYACTAGMLLAAALVCIFMTRQYKAESKVEILKQDMRALSLADASSAPVANSDALDFNLTLQTQLAVLKSDALAWQVIKELKLADTRNVFPNPASQTLGPAGTTPVLNTPAPDKRAAAILKRFKRNLTVDSVSGTRLIKVGYMHPDPKMAAKIVNQLVADFIEYNFQVRYAATTKATDFLGQQLVELKSQVEQAQQRAVQLEKESGIFGQDEHHNIVLTRLEQLNNEVTAAEGSRVLKEAVYRLSRSGNPEVVAGILGNQTERTPDAANTISVLNHLRQQEATLSAEYAEASTKYGPAYPRLIQMKERLTSVRGSVAGELRKIQERAKNEYEVAAAREAAAKKAFDEQKAIASQMNDKATNFLMAKHEADSSRGLYEHLLAKVKEAGVLAGLRSSELHVVDPAQVPTRPARPNIPLYLAFAALAGMFLGVVCIFVVETMDDSIRNVDEIESKTHVPVLGIIPRAESLPAITPKHCLKTGNGRNGSTHNSLLLSLRNPAIAEAFRAVRTSLLLSRPEEPVKVLMITSAMPQEGKSFTSLNLAAALAYHRGRVLLVDADLRRGTLSRLLEQQSGSGLSQFLAGEVGRETAYRAIDDVPGLTFMPAGPCPHGPSELLQSPRMTALIHTWRQQFAYVVIDTPPVLPLTDAVVLSPKVDAVIVVTRFAVTNRQSIIRTIRVLRDVQAARMGVLVNAVDVHSPEYYRYSGSYGYGEASGGESQLLVPPIASRS